MKRAALAFALLATAATAATLGTSRGAFAQAPPRLPPPPPPSTGASPLPPPPPPSTSPRYVPPSTPSTQDNTPSHRDVTPRRREPEPSPPPRRYVPPPSERYDRDEPPDARTGFQLALRTGISVPTGNLSGQANSPMSTTFKAQVPFLIDLGFKLTPNLFLGGVLGLAVGGAGADFRTANGCPATPSRSCVATDFRIGAEVQYHFDPDARMNPWLGLGFGYESATASASGNGANSSVNVTGLELLKLTGGLDFRVSRSVGVGPWVGLDLGQYGHVHTEAGGAGADGSLPSTALHEWLSVGVRVVFFP